MHAHASTAGWNDGAAPRIPSRSPRRGWEIAGIIAGFIFAWPLALAYLVWRLLGYPVPKEAKAYFDCTFTRLSENPFRSASRYRPTGNFAFDEYRHGEIERLERERRRLEDEAQAFAEFVEDVKRAKDRQEFDAFMAKRRSGTETA